MVEAWYVSEDGNDVTGNGSYDKPYKTVNVAKNGIALDNPSPYGIIYHKATGRLLATIPDNIPNKWVFVDFVGLGLK